MTASTITETIRRRLVATLIATQSLFTAAMIVSFTLGSVIAADLGGSDRWGGLPSTLTLVGRALFAYPMGWLLDRAGRRLGLSVGYIIGVLASVLAIWAVIDGSLFGFLAASALLGGARASSEQSRYIGAEIYPPERQSKIIGLIVFAGTIGIAAAFLVEPSTALAEGRGIEAMAGPYFLAAILLLLAAGVVFALLRPDPQAISLQMAAEASVGADHAAGEGAADPGRSLGTIFRDPIAFLAVTAMVIGQAVMTLLMVITALHMSRNGHDFGAISFVIFAHTLGMFGLSPATGWLVERLGRLVMITVGALVLIAACLLAPLSTALPLLALSLFLLGLGWNFSFVAGSALLSKQLEAGERGRAQGAGEVAVAAAAGVSGFGSGFVFAAGGITAVSLIGVALSLALLGLTVWRMVPRRAAEALAPGQD